MKEKIFLIIFGLVMGGIFFGGAYFFWNAQVSAGKRFSSLEEFHKIMTERDDRDIKSDHSVSLRSIIKPNLSEEIMYELRPDLDVKFQGVGLRTNSSGFRGREIKSDREVDTIYRIILLGDSFAFGWGVEEDRIFASVLEKELNNFTKGCPKIEVLNFGVPGYSTFQEVALFKEKGVPFKPDAVLVYFVNNDYYLPFFISDIHNKGEVVTSRSFSERFWAKEDEEIGKQHNKLAKLLDPNRTIKRLLNVLKPQGVELFLSINPGRSYYEDRKKLWIVKKERKNLHFIPLKKEIETIVKDRGIEKEKLGLKNDPHPSALKHQLLGEVLARGMIEAVKTSPRMAECSQST